MQTLRSTLLLVLLSPVLGRAAEPAFPLKAKRILILGDSITHAGHYVDWVEAHLRLGGVKPLPEVINLGLPSETCSGLSEASHPFPRPNVHERLDRALELTKPEVVVACYGMNDGIYHPFSDERFKAYQDGINRLIDKVHAAGAKLILLTPPPFDPVPLKDSGKLKPAGGDEYAWTGIYENYDEVLKRYGEWILQQKDRVEMVVDLHAPFTAFLKARRASDPAFTVTPDGIHPTPAGHRILAETILKAWGLQPLDSIDAELLKAVSHRQRLLHDAWLSHVGHNRPGMKEGLPIAQAKDEAKKLEREINAKVNEARFVTTSTRRSTGGTIYQVHFPGSPHPGELSLGVDYMLWVPDGAQVLRGIIVHQHGCGVGASQGGSTAADDLHWQALARKWDCALLGSQYEASEGTNCRLWCDPRNGSAKRFLEGLSQLAKLSGHGEVEQVPWCLWGHSGGGFWASLMQVAYPERIVAIWLRSGTAFGYWEAGEIEKPEIPPAAYEIPVMANPGVKERDHERFHRAWDGLAAMLASYRAQDAPFGFAGDPRTAHECGDSRYLAIPFFDVCLKMRLPEPASASQKEGPSPGEGGLGALRPVDRSSAWLAMIDGSGLAPQTEFLGNKQEAVWLPNEAFAIQWLEYVRTGAVSDGTAPPAPFSVTVQREGHNRRITWEPLADLESGISQFIILRDGKEIGRVPAEPKGRFGRPLFQAMSYHDTPERPLPECAFVDENPGEPSVPPSVPDTSTPSVPDTSTPSVPDTSSVRDTEHRYQVVAVNSVGEKSQATASGPDGFTALFNGRDLTGWTARPHAGSDPRKLAAMSPEERQQAHADWMKEARAHWRVENGELVNDGKGPYLTTEREFGDIELLIEYKTVPKADSGIYLRGTPQVQIWDYTKEGGKWGRGADKGSGGLFNNSPGTISKGPLVLADKPFGQWNQFRILQIGARTSVWLNGQLVVDHAIMENYWDRSLPLFAKGPIQLQTHGGEIRWRNIYVREIPAEQANAILAAHHDDGFRPIFNGKDFSGWEGPTDQYEVVDGAIVCRPGKGGNIYTSEEFEDFIVRLEFKLPPGGNNGLAIRYPGTGRPSVDAMTELQVLDNDHPRYAKLDPRQFHGSAYGLAAAHRGYLRPTGEWNFQEVTVQGHTIKVELNGTVILDADLSKITETKDNHPHPGKDLLKGHFGLAGHNEPVAFRNIQVRRLSPVERTSSWNQFRGPQGRGVGPSPSRVPFQIGPDKNVVWKVEVPIGHSSPVVADDRLFLTAVINELKPSDAADDHAAERPQPKLVTMALDTGDGHLLWQQPAPYEELEQIHQIGSHAQASVATDGERVVSFFGSSGLHCYSIDGEPLWTRPLGPFNNTFGAGASPLFVDDRVILAQDHDSDSFVMALDKRTGETIWKTDRSEFPRSFSTPVVWNVDGNRQIVVAGTLRVAGYDFDTGKELWTVRGLSRSVCATPTIGHDNTLYVAGWSQGGDETARISIPGFDELSPTLDRDKSGTFEPKEIELIGDAYRRFDQIDRDKSGSITREEYEYYRDLFSRAQNAVLAIQPGGRGDVSDSYVRWRHRRFVPFCCSPLAYNGYVFTVKDGGIVTSLDEQNGEVLQTKRASGNANYYASPVAANGKIYLFDQRGELTVIGANAEFKELWSADFGEDVYATPAIVGDRIYVRTVAHLYCFGSE